jgi:CelD/BcsL family acetyltransferase involved in cellulose biosynthesis
MQLYTLDPLLDSRWDKLVAIHPQSSVFHTSGWLRALARTYGYRPIVLTSSPPGQSLTDGIAFCEIKSWITGSRLVSLPFSDHAQPLLSEEGDTLELPEWVQTACSTIGWKYVELRPISAQPEWSPAFETSQSFWLHILSLAPPANQLLLNTHKSGFQRRIRHAKREDLEYERGATRELIGQFYDLLVITRKRHRLLPQPQSWFTNVVSEMSPDAEIRLVRTAGIPIAAILTLRHRSTVVYKYGCSDHRFHRVAGMPFLLWKLIEESKAEGAKQIDFGRTDSENRGLIEFKDRLGATRTMITYIRYPKTLRTKPINASGLSSVGRLFALLPGVVSSSLGRMLYRHIG